jgi:hypothetical protein
MNSFKVNLSSSHCQFANGDKHSVEMISTLCLNTDLLTNQTFISAELMVSVETELYTD